MRRRKIGIAVATLLACVLIAGAAAGYDVRLSGWAGRSGENGTLTISTLGEGEYKAISAGAGAIEGEVVADTTAFVPDKELVAGSIADASGVDTEVNSTTFVDGRYVGTIATAHAHGGEKTYTSAYASSSTATEAT